MKTIIITVMLSFSLMSLAFFSIGLKKLITGKNPQMKRCGQPECPSGRCSACSNRH